jgi:hypothetical protein
MELAICYPSDDHNFGVVPRLLEDLYNREKKQGRKTTMGKVRRNHKQQQKTNKFNVSKSAYYNRINFTLKISVFWYATSYDLVGIYQCLG